MEDAFFSLSDTSLVGLIFDTELQITLFVSTMSTISRRYSSSDVFKGHLILMVPDDISLGPLLINYVQNLRQLNIQ